MQAPFVLDAATFLVCVTMRNPGPLKPAGFVGSHRDRLIVLQPVRQAG